MCLSVGCFFFLRTPPDPFTKRTRGTGSVKKKKPPLCPETFSNATVRRRLVVVVLRPNVGKSDDHVTPRTVYRDLGGRRPFSTDPAYGCVTDARHGRRLDGGCRLGANPIGRRGLGRGRLRVDRSRSRPFLGGHAARFRYAPWPRSWRDLVIIRIGDGRFFFALFFFFFFPCRPRTKDCRNRFEGRDEIAFYDFHTGFISILRGLVARRRINYNSNCYIPDRGRSAYFLRLSF